MGKIAQMELSDFITSQSKTFFSILGIQVSFMVEHPPDAWPALPDYQAAQQTVDALRVVNDTAERGVKLVSDYSQILTKDESQLQFILQTVEDHRRKLPNMSKSAIVRALKTDSFSAKREKRTGLVDMTI